MVSSFMHDIGDLWVEYNAHVEMDVISLKYARPNVEEEIMHGRRTSLHIWWWQNYILICIASVALLYRCGGAFERVCFLVSFYQIHMQYTHTAQQHSF